MKNQNQPMADLIQLSCNACGAPLEVGPNAKFVTCNHCSTRLAVRRTESASFTEALENLAESTGRLTTQMDRIAVQNDIERLDREFESKYGHLPGSASVAESIFTGGFAIIWGIIWCGITGVATTIIGNIHPLPALIPGGLCAIGIYAVFASFSSRAKLHSAASTRQAAEKHYTAERSQLVRKLDDCE